jgi:hypothetical protein
MKTSVTLPLTKKTPGALLYSLPNYKDQIVSNVYVRKDHMPTVDGAYPESITITIEVPE